MVRQLTKRMRVAATFGLLGMIAAFLFLADDSYFTSPLSRQQQRWLDENSYDKSFYRTTLDPAESTLSVLKQNFVPYFIHVPKSGGSSVLNYYRCFGVATAGIHRNKYGKGVLKMDMQRFIDDSPVGQMVSGGGLWQAASGIYPEYTGNRKGRAFAVFRNPVERLVSLYYYLQVATWEKDYDKDLGKKMSLVEFATSNASVNALYRTLITGLQQPEEGEGMDSAKMLLNKYVLVGLTNQMTESLHRFDMFLGYSSASFHNDRYAQCKKKYWKQGQDDEEYRENKNDHTSLDPDSDDWKVIADANSEDMELFAYIENLFVEQGKFLDEKYGWKQDHGLARFEDDKGAVITAE